MADTHPPSKVHDLARAASLLLDAVQSAPNRAIETVETCYGRADVVLDEEGADVVLHDRDVTVHLRREGGVDPDGRDG
jgi:hypothetical protein